MAEADERAGLLAPPRATGKSAVVSWWHGVVAGGLLLFVAGLSDEVQGLWRTRQASAIVRGVYRGGVGVQPVRSSPQHRKAQLRKAEYDRALEVLEEDGKGRQAGARSPHQSARTSTRSTSASSGLRSAVSKDTISISARSPAMSMPGSAIARRPLPMCL